MILLSSTTTKGRDNPCTKQRISYSQGKNKLFFKAYLSLSILQEMYYIHKIEFFHII